jgi:hypothetical protein
MYRIPADIDLTFLLSTTLEQIWVSQYIIHFRFDNRSVISTVTDFKCVTPHTHEHLFDIECVGTCYALLGNVVTGCTIRSPTELEISFGSSGSLVFCDSNDVYESFQIYLPDGTAIIV